MSLNRVMMLSVHSCPLDILGGRDTGGMNVYVRELSRKLGERGIWVDIFTRSKYPSIPKIVHINENVRVVHIKAGIEAPYHKNLIWNYLPEFQEGIYNFAREEGITYDLIHSHYWLSGVVASKLGQILGIPIVHMSHTMGFLKNQVARSDDEKDISLRLENEIKVIRAADRIVAATPLEKFEINREFDIPLNRIEVIPCGVDLNLFKHREPEEARKHLGLNGQKFILFVGRIDPIKGIDNLIRAMNILAKVDGNNGDGLRLLIIGGTLSDENNEEKSELKNLIELTSELNLGDRVEFLGTKSQDLLPCYYSSAEVCVLPSRYESFGIVALESMACGTPVIASEVGGLPYVMGEGETGFLVPEGNPEILAERISFIVGNPFIKEKFGREAVKQAERFEWSLIADKVVNLYSQLLS
ncbi:MAG: glycosyltransferase family 1 protein [Nitrospiraceae bacterium]|nr:MAG: glycosyltransferase family 1 protein [Nitrospiraceae bacterium]